MDVEVLWMRFRPPGVICVTEMRGAFCHVLGSFVRTCFESMLLLFFSVCLERFRFARSGVMTANGLGFGCVLFLCGLLFVVGW